MIRCTKPWKPTHRLFLLTNVLPLAKADDKAFWARLSLSPVSPRMEVANA